MNRKFFLVKLIEQLEEEKVDSLIDVVKGMVYPFNEKEASYNQTNQFNTVVTDYDNSEASVTQSINDIFR